MNNSNLWEKYHKTRDKIIKDQLISENIELVKIIAGRLYSTYKNNVEFDDLVSYGIFGLLDAIEKFDPLRNVKFETYAYIRVRGAIIDQIRSMDWVPRSVRQKYKRIEEAYNAIETRCGRSASEDEVAEILGIPLGDLNDTLTEIHSYSVISLEERITNNPNFTIIDGDTEKDPEKSFAQEEVKTIMMQVLKELPEKEQRVISLYYYSELTYKEISFVMGVSESRISQIHTKAIMKLRSKLDKVF